MDNYNSLEELERLYRETEDKEKRSNILKKMESIVSEKEEYEINYSNFITSPKHAGMIELAEKHLGTRDKKKVIEFIVKTLGYPENYTKEHWISEIKKLGGNPVVRSEEKEKPLKTGDRIKHKEIPGLEYIVDKVTDDAIYCSYVYVGDGKAVLRREGFEEKYEVI